VSRERERAAETTVRATETAARGTRSFAVPLGKIVIEGYYKKKPRDLKFIGKVAGMVTILRAKFNRRIAAGLTLAMMLLIVTTITQAKVLTEISLHSRGTATGVEGEVSRFLWEPDRYDPTPTEILFEVVVDVSFSGSVTFRLQDVTNGVPIEGSSITVDSGQAGRFRTVDISSSFPVTPAEIALVTEKTGGPLWQIRRSAVLVQQ